MDASLISAPISTRKKRSNVAGTVTNEHKLRKLLRFCMEMKRQVHGDAGYAGIHKCEEHRAREVEWYIAIRLGKRKTMAEGSDELKTEQAKASIRAKVEHPFRWVKGKFGYDKVRYLGLDKNMNRLYLMRSRNLVITG